MFFIRPIEPQDNPHIAAIIRNVSAEFGLAADSGFAVGDQILDHLFENYQQEKSHYWVIVDQNNHVLGGGGAAPLVDAPDVLEIQKMYFLPQLRRQGFAQQILAMVFEFARYHHIETCYLETTHSLMQAVELYKKMGFEILDHPLGETGHSHACEIWMAKHIEL